MMMVFCQISGLTPVVGVLWMFALAFFDNLLGKKKTLTVIAAFSLWSMIDETIPWAVVTLHSMIGNLGPPPSDIEFQVYTFITILAILGTFVGLLGWNLLQLKIVKYLVKRWRLKERCGIMARQGSVS
jgi:hypothetical protein